MPNMKQIKMKNFAFCILSILVLFSCKEESKNSTETETVVTDSTEIANTIHGFYKWYDVYVSDETKLVNFTKVAGKHLTLDIPLLDKYLADIKGSGFVSAELLEADKAFYQSLEKIWQTEDSAEGIPTGMDADRYFCAQDWDINFWTQAPVRIKSIGKNKIAASLYGTQAESPSKPNFELKKENGKWLLAKIECNMGSN